MEIFKSVAFRKTSKTPTRKNTKHCWYAWFSFLRLHPEVTAHCGTIKVDHTSQLHGGYSVMKDIDYMKTKY